MLANAKFWSFYCKTWYSEYSKWLPPAAFWNPWVHKIRFRPGLRPVPDGGVYGAPSNHLASLKGSTYKGGKEHGMGERGQKGKAKELEGPVPYANSWIRPWLWDPVPACSPLSGIRVGQVRPQLCYSSNNNVERLKNSDSVTETMCVLTQTSTSVQRTTEAATKMQTAPTASAVSRVHAT